MEILFLCLLIFSQSSFAQEYFSADAKCGPKDLQFKLTAEPVLPASATLYRSCYTDYGSAEQCMDLLTVKQGIRYNWTIYAPGFFGSYSKQGAIDLTVGPTNHGHQAMYGGVLGFEIDPVVLSNGETLHFWLQTSFNSRAKVSLDHLSDGTFSVDRIENLTPESFSFNMFKKDATGTVLPVCNGIGRFNK